ncbi:hypothetical protein [Phreatobacter sp.]|uniref:hypothetical protein n=1 Tax=Phreatobacter sp. TaxID=1966341 RepID=UPI0022C938AE|nr:hypothetical protein [Phreatobacter sp.]MCZ8313681.1 hypothetical protein [Phreatobacter sp.]
MATFHSFDDKAIASVLEATSRHYDAAALESNRREINPIDDGHIRIAAQCISVTVENGKICLNLPLGIGKYCLPIPSIIPDGTAAQACLDICTTWGIPTGVRVTVSVAGKVILEKTFLKC